MATSIEIPENKLVTELGKLHPDYTIALHQPFNEVYPYLHVTNGKYEVNTQIRLAKHLWDVKVIDRLVEKSISKIEDSPQSATPEEGKGETPKKSVSQFETHKKTGEYWMTNIDTLESILERFRDESGRYIVDSIFLKQALNLYIEEKIKEQFVDKVKPYASKKSKEAFVSGYLQGFRDCNLGRDNKYEHEE